MSIKKPGSNTNLSDAMCSAGASPTARTGHPAPVIVTRRRLQYGCLQQWFKAVAASLVVAVCSVLPTPLHAQVDCLPTDPVACSTEWLNVALPIALFSEIFVDACMRHDYCYRFGAATYGYTRARCDRNFYNDMLDICSPEWWEVALTLGLTTAACHSAALGYYSAVRNRGASAYQNKQSGKVCHYELALGEKRRPINPYTAYWILLF